MHLGYRAMLLFTFSFGHHSSHALRDCLWDKTTPVVAMA